MVQDYEIGQEINYNTITKGGFKKTKTVNLGLWPKLGGGFMAGSEGPSELFGDQKCRNNESFS